MSCPFCLTRLKCLAVRLWAAAGVAAAAVNIDLNCRSCAVVAIFPMAAIFYGAFYSF